MTAMRKVIVYGQAWEFSTGRFNAVIKNPHTKKKMIVDFAKLTGRSWDILERGQHKRTIDGMIKPGHVKAYIEKHLAEKPQKPSAKTKIAKGPPSRIILYQEWEESERGWGVRPDGFSLHIDAAHRGSFIETSHKREHEISVKHGMHPDDVPNEYSRVSGSALSINVPKKVYDQLNELGGDFRSYSRKIRVDAAHNLTGLGPKGLVE
jgi:hypothetical protein